jgi:hypothetical protein
MESLIREERYIVFDGGNEYVLRVQEIMSGTVIWPGKLRVEIAASADRAAAKFYGATVSEVVEKAANYLSSSVSDSRYNIGSKFRSRN